MSPFEYTTILVSIILGLGIAQIVAGMADALYHPLSIRPYWPHTAWVAILLFLLVQDWIVTYQLKSREIWDLPTILFVLSYPALLYMMAHLLFPPEAKDEPIDMAAYFHKIRPSMLQLFLATVVFSVVFNIWLLGMQWQEQWVLYVLSAAILWLLLAKVENERIHRLFTIALLAGLTISTVLQRHHWVIG